MKPKAAVAAASPFDEKYARLLENRPSLLANGSMSRVVMTFVG